VVSYFLVYLEFILANFLFFLLDLVELLRPFRFLENLILNFDLKQSHQENDEKMCDKAPSNKNITKKNPPPFRELF
jgi:hypothetical protein